jgi:molecular chaperone GrpE
VNTEDPGSPPGTEDSLETEASSGSQASPSVTNPAADSLSEAEKKNRELSEKLKETNERMLRAAADLDNYRKRVFKEKEELRKFGAEKLLKDFLQILDNLDRALEHARTGQDFESLREGVAMTRKLFEDTLARHGVTPVAALGKPFDPHLHDALQHIETKELAPNHVISEVVKGYLLNERLMRPSLVVVSKEPRASDEEPKESVSEQIPPSESVEASEETASPE